MAGRPRVVIASPSLAECEALSDWLRLDGFEPVPITDLCAASTEVRARPFDLLVADFGFAFRDGLHGISRGRIRSTQTPTVVIGDRDPAAQAHAERRQAVYVERPVERAGLLCIVSIAILEGRPARRSPRKILDRFQAVMDSVPCYLIDVSNEGLRLELPREQRATPPPYFSVRVPKIGVTLMVQRIWTNVGLGAAGCAVAWCGGALARNAARAEQGWRAFVQALPG
jgi:hypothetical protein